MSDATSGDGSDAGAVSVSIPLHDVLRDIHALLDRLELHASATALRAEAGVGSELPLEAATAHLQQSLQFVRDVTLNGAWNEVHGLIDACARDAAELGVEGDELNELLRASRASGLKQEFLEAFSSSAQASIPGDAHAMILVRLLQRLEPLCPRAEFNSVSYTLTLPHVRAHPHLRDWSPMKGRSDVFAAMRSLVTYVYADRHVPASQPPLDASADALLHAYARSAALHVCHAALCDGGYAQDVGDVLTARMPLQLHCVREAQDAYPCAQDVHVDGVLAAEGGDDSLLPLIVAAAASARPVLTPATIRTRDLVTVSIALDDTNEDEDVPDAPMRGSVSHLRASLATTAAFTAAPSDTADASALLAHMRASAHAHALPAVVEAVEVAPALPPPRTPPPASPAAAATEGPTVEAATVAASAAETSLSSTSSVRVATRVPPWLPPMFDCPGSHVYEGYVPEHSIPVHTLTRVSSSTPVAARTPIRALARIDDSEHILIGSNDRRVTVLSAELQPLHSITVHSGSVYALACTRVEGGLVVASVSNDTRACILTLNDAWEERSRVMLDPGCGTLRTCSWAGRDTLLCGGGGDYALCVYDAATSKLTTRLRAHTDTIMAVVPWGDPGAGHVQCVTAGADGALCVWDTRMAAPIAVNSLSVRGRVDALTCVSVRDTPSVGLYPREVMVGTRSGDVACVDVTCGRVCASAHVHSSEVRGLTSVGPVCISTGDEHAALSYTCMAPASPTSASMYTAATRGVHAHKALNVIPGARERTFVSTDAEGCVHTWQLARQ